MIGIQDKALSERLQLTQDLDLAKAVDKCRTSELVKKQMSEQTTTANLDAVRRQPNKQTRFNYGKPKNLDHISNHNFHSTRMKMNARNVGMYIMFLTNALHDG